MQDHEYRQLLKQLRKYADKNLFKAVSALRKVGWSDVDIARELGYKDSTFISRRFGKGRGK